MMALLPSTRRFFWTLSAFIVCVIISWLLFVTTSSSFRKKFHPGNYTQTKSLANKSLANKNSANKSLANKSLANKSLANKSLANKSLANKNSANKSLANKSLANKSLANKNLANKSLANKSLANKSLANKSLANKSSANKNSANKSLANKSLANKNLANKSLANDSLANDSLANKSLAQNSLAQNSLAQNSLAQNSLTQNSLAHNTSNVMLHRILEERKQSMLHLLRNPGTSSLPSVQSVKCPRIWENDHGEINASLSKALLTQPLRLNFSDYLNKTKNCTEYFLKEGYNLATVSEEETTFPLAFSLLVYKDVEQVERLLRGVYRPHNVYCIHADKKSSKEFHAQLRLIVSCLPNVLMTENSIPVKWGTFSVLEPEIMCMNMMWTHYVKWRYFINLTGQEFPLKTNKELVKILKSFKGANDISGTRDATFFSRWKHVLPVPYNLTLFKGDVHIVASREFVDFAIHSRVAHELLQWVIPTHIPDETFFNTLNYNKQLGVPGSHSGSIHNTTMYTFSRYKVWKFHHTMCSGIWTRSICQFCLGDLHRLTHSQQLFANKFSYDYCSLAYDCLEEWYFNKIHLENINQSAKLDTAVYENSNLVKHRYTGPVLLWE